ncbi:uncharacterized protein LOC124284339 [Haliotis rubra]|uniref:uncharacterized protein LOC124284339 n=1 Tax=Haliotis rubra TaxID=36100 RepID=UPI001EE5B5C9|nr:uncharacterized protein LOC124284339 [Haliotis rubra]
MSLADCLRTAENAFGANDFEKALSYYDKIDKGNDVECTTEVYLKKAQCLLGLERYEEATIEAEKCTTRDPLCVTGYLVQGQSLTMRGKFEDAYRAYKSGLDVNADDKAIAAGLRHLQHAIVTQYEAADKEAESNYDALKMCSQERYPGDDDVERLEKEIMETWKLFDAPNITPLVPNPELSRARLIQGLKAKAKGALGEALEEFTAALEHDATNFENWKGRIEVLYEQKDYREAFRTVNSFSESVRSAEVWLLGGKILAGLELPLMAETWLRRSTQLNKDKDNKEAAILFQTIRVARLYGPLAAKTNADVIFNQYGRAVKAKKDMRNHDIILTDKPVILAQTLATQDVPACCQCAVSMLKPEGVFTPADLKNEELKKAIAHYWPKRKIHPCQGCSREIYCSIKCRDEAWTTYHRVVCPSVNKTINRLYEVCDDYKSLKGGDGQCWKGWWNASFSPFVLVRMWGTIACEAKRLAEKAGRSIPIKSDWSMAQAPLRRFIAYGSSSNADVIPKMFQLMIEIFKDLGDGLKYEITKREFDGRYFQATCNVQAFSDSRNPLRIFIERFRDNPRWKGIAKFIPADPPEGEFAGMFPLHACMNHSCANSAEVMDYVVDGKPGVGVRVRGGIKKGEEVCITYINTTMPRRQRRAWLYRSYNFWCRCIRCNFEGDGPMACTQCGKSADEGKKFPQCSKCKRAWYCSTACQKQAWKKGHKKICK